MKNERLARSSRITHTRDLLPAAVESRMMMSPSRLVHMPSLCARLRLLLGLYGQELYFRGASGWWNRTVDLLLAPASIARVDTDATLADLYDSDGYCSAAVHYNDTQSNLLDDYMLRLTRFHFVWHAYATVRDHSESGQKLTSKDLRERLPILSAQPIAHKELLDFFFSACERLAMGDPQILKRLRRGNETTVVGKAGHLVAGFRDYLFHGHEAPPKPNDLEGPLIQKLRHPPTSSVQASRMIAFTRLTLHMLQALLHADLRTGVSIPVNYVRFLSTSVYDEHGDDIPCSFALNLATFWPDVNHPRLDEQEVKYVAEDCSVSAASLSLLASY